MNKKKTSKKQNICVNTCCNKQVCEAKSDMSCFNKIAGTLTGEEIKKHGIIDTSLKEYAGDDNSFQSTTYDLRLGDAHYIYDATLDSGSKNWKQIFIGDDENKLIELNKTEPKFERQIGSMCSLTIPPYASALIQLEEIVNTYSVAYNNILIVGRFDLKLSIVHKGLISQQATQVEPCYKGKLFCFLHNLSNNKIDIPYKESIATIEFSYVSCFCNEEKRKEIIVELMKKNKSKYYDSTFCYIDNGIKDIRWFGKKSPLPSDCGLASFNNSFYKKQEEIDKWIKNSKQTLEEEFETFIGKEDTISKVANMVNKHLTWKVTLMTSIVSIVTLLLGGGIFKIYTDLNEKINKYQTTIKELENRIEKSENEVINKYQKITQEQKNRIEKLENELDEIIKTKNKPISSKVNTSLKTERQGE